MKKVPNVSFFRAGGSGGASALAVELDSTVSDSEWVLASRDLINSLGFHLLIFFFVFNLSGFKPWISEGANVQQPAGLRIRIFVIFGEVRVFLLRCKDVSVEQRKHWFDTGNCDIVLT